MPQQDFDTSQDPTFAELNSPANVEVKQALSELQHSKELGYQAIALETWALAQTMDEFIPGFWSRFLENRHQSLQQFLQIKKHERFRVIEW